MPFVLDASLALAWHFEDEVSEYADRVLDRVGEDRALVPSVWELEIANALAVAERRGRLSPAGVARAVELFLELAISIHEVALESALGPVLDLARTQGMTAYDAAYLELAMREGLPLATEDEALRAAALRVGVPLVD
ncbi:MAG: type II toxin-antitoxin system VapC family toxin [Chloroflexota bacterium]|nr:type II toxin-antitoxin system VapC family toxin [Chloroflexota bacterium]